MQSDEEEGSSVEEEDEEPEGEGEGDLYQDAPSADEDLPSYSHPAKDSGIRIGANGYAVHEKGSAKGVQLSDPGVARKPSKRQQEKAPEGRAPHRMPDEAVPGSFIDAGADADADAGGTDEDADAGPVADEEGSSRGRSGSRFKENV
jgi:hypothetical protein